MKKIVSTALLGLVGLVAVGLLSLQTAATSQANDEVSKRDDDTPDLVLVADDDDDDTSDGASSRYTADSRDRDLSRSDKTRDRTRDGSGGRERDWSNDRSRDDTRR